LGGLRRAGVGRPDLVVAVAGDRSDAAAVLALMDRFGDLAVLAPPLHRVPHARVATIGRTVSLGSATVVVVSAVPLVVEVEPRLLTAGKVAAGEVMRR
ncbi:MAG: hypothetical protein ACE5GB_14830, partial [Acidimicrobiales bacterium]